MNNLILAYIIRFLKIPLFVLSPFILCNILYGLFCRYVYNPFEANRIYIFIKLHEDNPIIMFLDSLFYKTYSIISNIDILRNVQSIFMPVNSILFVVDLLYLLYFSVTGTGIIIILIFFKKLNKLNMIRKNTNFFRSLANNYIEIKLLDIEIRLLMTDNIAWYLAQFSLFFFFGYILYPYIMEVYIVILDNIMTLLPIPFIGILSTFFLIFVVLTTPLISLIVSFSLMRIFFKKNILINLFQKIIIKNFIQLNNIEKEKYGKNTNTLKRIAIFNNPIIKNTFKNYKK